MTFSKSKIVSALCDLGCAVSTVRGGIVVWDRAGRARTTILRIAHAYGAKVRTIEYGDLYISKRS